MKHSITVWEVDHCGRVGCEQGPQHTIVFWGRRILAEIMKLAAIVTFGIERVPATLFHSSKIQAEANYAVY
jgi:hypothetical protein